MKQPRLNRNNFESSINVLKCLLATAGTCRNEVRNKTLQQYTSINNKNSQSNNVHAKVTAL